MPTFFYLTDKFIGYNIRDLLLRNPVLNYITLWVKIKV